MSDPVKVSCRQPGGCGRWLVEIDPERFEVIRQRKPVRVQAVYKTVRSTMTILDSMAGNPSPSLVEMSRPVAHYEVVCNCTKRYRVKNPELGISSL